MDRKFSQDYKVVMQKIMQGIIRELFINLDCPPLVKGSIVMKMIFLVNQ